MQQSTIRSFPIGIGLDLGNKDTQCAIYCCVGVRIEERKVTTDRDQFTTLFCRFPGARAVMEASTATR